MNVVMHKRSKFHTVSNNTVPKPGLLLNAVLHIRPLTFINEVLCLSVSPFAPYSIQQHSAVVVKGFISSFKPKPGLLLNAVLHIRPLTFINEVLCLSVSPFAASTLSS